jgi:site-specific DNA-methyltransferase (adenine-specific)
MSGPHRKSAAPASARHRLQPLFSLQNTLHWIKSITVQPKRSPELSVGHFKPINSRRYLTDCHEYIFHLTASGDVPLDRLAVGTEYSDKSNIARWGHTGGRDRRCRGITGSSPTRRSRAANRSGPHPATFPAQLAEWCIRLHGARPDLTALDPFLGLGHSAEGARNCEIARFIGFEIDAAYLQEARERLGLPPVHGSQPA